MWVHVKTPDEPNQLIFETSEVSFVVVQEQVASINFRGGNIVVISIDVWHNIATMFAGHDGAERYHGRH